MVAFEAPSRLYRVHVTGKFVVNTKETFCDVNESFFGDRMSIRGGVILSTVSVWLMKAE